MRDTVHVPLGDRAYDVRIGPGLIAAAGKEVAPFLTRPRVAILTDETVADLHLKPLQTALGSAGIESAALALPAGEGTKNWAALQQCVEWLLAEKVERFQVQFR